MIVEASKGAVHAGHGGTEVFDSDIEMGNSGIKVDNIVQIVDGGHEVMGLGDSGVN